MSYDHSALNPVQRSSTPPSGVSQEAGARISRHHGPWMSGPIGAAPAVECWVVGLNLLAIRPACLKAKSTDLSDQQWPEARPAAALEQEQHSLHLDLEVVLSNQSNIPAPALFDTQAYGASIEPSAFPVLLQRAELELTVLSKHAQLFQQQYSLLQLLPHDPDHHHQQLQEQLLQLSVVADNPKSLTALLQLYITCPSQPTEQALNCLHLLLTLKSTDPVPQHLQQQLEQHVPTEISSSMRTEYLTSSTVAEMRVSAAANRPAVGLVAQVPLLVLPAVAQQEVQQLLLPAMRQEVQAEQQQQQQEPISPHWPTLAAHDEVSLHTEHRIWQHYQQLANDIHTVTLLVDMLRNPVAEAAAASIAAAAAGAAATPQASNQLAAVEVIEAISAVFDTEGSSEGSSAAGVDAAAAAAPLGLSSEAALSSIADNLLFPVLLPFLAEHGLHNLLQLLVSCLPGQLQQQWEEQQQERLVAGDGVAATAAAPAAEVAAAAGGTAVGGSCTAATDRLTQVGQQEAQQSLSHQHPPAPDSGKEGFEHRSTPTEQQQQQQEAEEGDLKHGSKSAAVGSASSMAAGDPQAQPAAAAGAGPHLVRWYTPLLQFDRPAERRYLAWKHCTLLHLDYIGALFAVMYLLTLLRRMINEPTTLFYLIYVLLKCMPLAPLILGFREPFLRHRELWLWLVIPASILTFIFVKLQYLATPTMLLPQRALSAYWNGYGEVMTSAMRPFIQHMRVRPYIAYTLADAAMCVWVFAQLHGYRAVIWRWGFAVSLSISLCWGLDLRMRRKFVALRR